MSRTKRRNNSAARNRRTPATRKPSSTPTTTKTSKTSSRAWMLVSGGVLGLAVAALIGIAVVDTDHTTGAEPATSSNPVTLPTVSNPVIVPAMNPVELTRWELAPQTLNELLALSPDELERVDPARINLLCATGLPGAEWVTPEGIEHALRTLDRWAERVAFETERHLYRVTDPRYAERYNGSEAHFRAEMLAQVLQEDLGVKYNMTADGNFSFANSSVAFIHGMIPAPGQSMADTPGGTCASMPALYVAVGKRLGYPLYMAATDGHLFARWDGANHEKPGFRGRFNCETTNGFHKTDDAYYLSWPYEVTPARARFNGYLRSLKHAQDLASSLAARGHCGFDHNQRAFAARNYENAFRFDPIPAYANWFAHTAISLSDYRPATPQLAQRLHRARVDLAARRQIERAMHRRHDVILPTSQPPMPRAVTAASLLSQPPQPPRPAPVAGRFQPQINPVLPQHQAPPLPGHP